jgi:hypothetical protein
MNKSIIRKVFAFGCLVVLGLSLSLVVSADEVQLTSPITATDFKSFFTSLAEGVAAIIGPAAVLMIVIAGVLFVTSAGSPEKIKTAKTCLIYAIIGGIIAGTAKIIVETFLK